MEDLKNEVKDENLIERADVILKIAKLYKFTKNKIDDFLKQLDAEDNILVEPAIVVRLDPLLIAVNHRLFENCTIYKYPDFFKEMFDLKIGTRLLSKNNYETKKDVGRNVLLQGSVATSFNNVTPYILNFFFQDFKTEDIHISNYFYSVLENKAQFSLKFDRLAFDGINKRMEVIKDETNS